MGASADIVGFSADEGLYWYDLADWDGEQHRPKRLFFATADDRRDHMRGKGVRPARVGERPGDNSWRTAYYENEEASCAPVFQQPCKRCGCRHRGRVISSTKPELAGLCRDCEGTDPGGPNRPYWDPWVALYWPLES